MSTPADVSRPSASAASLLALVSALPLLTSCGGREMSTGEIVGPGRSHASVDQTLVAQQRALEDFTRGPASPGDGREHRILFGDLHVHTTFSIDAFVFALPLFAGEGAHPPADACDFARYCAGVDFFSINDHAEGLTPERWRATIDSIRECNARAGSPEDPDLVAFMGYEWTQAGRTPEEHYGHKNVIFEGLGDADVPERPITSLRQGTMNRAAGLGATVLLEPLPRLAGGYADFLWWVRRMSEVPDCPSDVSSAALPPDCRENAGTPEVLFGKLREGGHEPLVIPHGLGWGIHAPPGARLDNQLSRAAHDPERQRLLEVFSGHGNSEEFRARPNIDRDLAVCESPTPEYLPCCWQAGEIVRARCDDPESAECEERVTEARALALRAGVSPHLVLPDTQQEDWLDCDQCRDCFKPAMNLRPGETAQYGLAISNFSEPEPDGTPQRFEFGLIASSDNHGGRPGTGYKQYARREMTDARGLASERWDRLLRGWIWGRQQDPQRAQGAPDEERGLRGLLDVEREASFMYPGGLVAVHSESRNRGDVFAALNARRAYGTSGPRILLWFDLLNASNVAAPMGSRVAMSEAPLFRVRVVGSFEQMSGCGPESLEALGAERLERLCRGECYRPSDRRRPITEIQIVRIRPQREPGESIAELIEDPWRVFPCTGEPGGCEVTFADADFTRDTAYYVRALEAPSLAVNGANVRTAYDDEGNAISTEPCFGDYRTPATEDCLAPVAERAWSSPIFVDYVSSVPVLSVAPELALDR